MEKYLKAGKYIDWEHELIIKLADELSFGLVDETEIAKKCFEWVRDEIKHTSDYCLGPITCKASDVLKYGTGYCYAKSNLLAALLRANKIPAGLSYQRLSLAGDDGPYCLHGLNSVYLKKYGWYRVDARGNKTGINAQFCPPVEQLAFSVSGKGEADLIEIWDEPLPVVIEPLIKYDDYITLNNNLPDIDLIKI
jgi:transglutaminase-like putative cysteine protease